MSLKHFIVSKLQTFILFNISMHGFDISKLSNITSFFVYFAIEVAKNDDIKDLPAPFVPNTANFLFLKYHYLFYI